MKSEILRHRAGTTAVEFAMVAPLVLYSVVALLDVSRYVMTSQALEAGVDRASRVAMVSSGDSAAAATEASLRDVVLEYAFAPDAAPSVSAVCANLPRCVSPPQPLIRYAGQNLLARTVQCKELITQFVQPTLVI